MGLTTTKATANSSPRFTKSAAGLLPQNAQSLHVLGIPFGMTAAACGCIQASPKSAPLKTKGAAPARLRARSRHRDDNLKFGLLKSFRLFGLWKITCAKPAH